MRGYPISGFPQKGRPMKIAARDGRHASRRQGASAAITYTTKSRVGCRLTPTDAIIESGNGNAITLEQYREYVS